MDSRVSEAVKKLLEARRIMKRDDIKNVEYLLLCTLIRRKLKEDFEKLQMSMLVMATERKQNLKKSRRCVALPSNNEGAEERGWKSSQRPDRNGKSLLEILHESVRARYRHSRTSNSYRQVQALPALINEVRNTAFRMKS